MPRVVSTRVFLLAGLMALALTACGRRGALEPPPGLAAATKAQQEEAATLPSPVGTPRRNRPVGFVPPNRPFILDPLL